MKLLIADDELLTREGLISSIDWKALGINEIFQADDGLNALNIARTEQPDIVLSDIRMPRLNGIEMVHQLEKEVPDASIIFMSGYSDKEYLKAAIKLKAINYVEKPLNPDEIREAVLEAIRRREQTLRTRQNESLYSLETSSNLARLLTRPYKDNKEEICQLSDILQLSPVSGCFFVSYIVKLDTSEPDTFKMNQLLLDLDDFLAHYHLRSTYVRMHAFCHVFHIIGKKSPSPTALSGVEAYLKERFHLFGNYYIVRGECVTGISKVYQSYASAVVTLQSSFFFKPCTLLIAEDNHPDTTDNAAILSGEMLSDFTEALLSKNQSQAEEFLSSLYQHYHESSTFMPNQVKDIYYKLFNILNDCRQKLKVDPDTFKSDDSIIENLENCFSFDELHQNLVSKTEYFFNCIHSYVPEDPTIFMIKDYIARNYANDRLSIKEISEHVFLSASYVCTYFKNQTGQTLNQYLTEYRMEKAKQLLGDARYQITDISSKVGYSNSNYFSKSFKKFTGLSPSKYRENILG